MDKTYPNIITRQLSTTVRPISLICGWATVIAAGGMDLVDANPLVNPDTEISDTTRRLIDLLASPDYGNYGGNQLKLRLSYPSGMNVTVPPSVKVFGRATAEDDWQILQNLAGEKSVIMTTTSDDVDNGTMRFSHSHRYHHTFDFNGCSQFLIGVEGALTASAGDVNLAELLYKII